LNAGLEGYSVRPMNPFRKRLRVFMSPTEQSAIGMAIALLARPLVVLEWGSGGSSVHFGKLIPESSRWLAIEHQAKWATRVRSELAREGVDGVSVVHVEANCHYEEGVGDGTEEAFRDYVHHPASLGDEYDLMLVDGRARVACAQLGWGLLRADGIMALHDAQRAQYAAAQPKDAFFVRLRDPREQCDGGDIELHFYLKQERLAAELASAIRSASDEVVEVTLTAP
jgi:predicted O-methyltransferase YrrM